MAETIRKSTKRETKWERERESIDLFCRGQVGSKEENQRDCVVYINLNKNIAEA